MPKILIKSSWVMIPNGDAKYTCGRKNVQHSTNNSLYLENGNVSMKDEWEVVCTLSKGNISDDIE